MIKIKLVKHFPSRWDMSFPFLCQLLYFPHKGRRSEWKETSVSQFPSFIARTWHITRHFTSLLLNNSRKPLFRLRITINMEAVLPLLYPEKRTGDTHYTCISKRTKDPKCFSEIQARLCGLSATFYSFDARLLINFSSRFEIRSPLGSVTIDVCMRHVHRLVSACGNL